MSDDLLKINKIKIIIEQFCNSEEYHYVSNIDIIRNISEYLDKNNFKEYEFVHLFHNDEMFQYFTHIPIYSYALTFDNRRIILDFDGFQDKENYINKMSNMLKVAESKLSIINCSKPKYDNISVYYEGFNEELSEIDFCQI